MANDVSILASVLGVLVIMGLILPWVGEMVGNTESDPTNPDFNQTLTEKGLSETTYSGLWTAAKGIATSFFWLFTWMPAWLQALHLLLRIIGIFIFIRLARGTG